MPDLTDNFAHSLLSEVQKAKLELAQKNAEEIIDKLAPVYVRDTLQLFTAPDGKLIANGEVAVGEQLEQLEGMYTTVAGQKLVLNHVMNRCVTTLRDLEPPTDLIPVKNGVVSVSTGELLPYKRGMTFFNEFSVEYDPKAAWPKKILAEIRAAQPDPAIQYRILRSWALCFDRTPMKRQVELWIGDNDTRKSTLLNVLSALLGKENTSNQTLESLTATDKEAQHSRAKLIGKAANIFADLSEIAIKQVGMLKALLGGDTVPARIMYQSPVEVALYTKLFFGCNKPPDILDESIWLDNAFLERFRITFFENRIDRNDIIENYLPRLTTKEELSGLFNILLGILRGVRAYDDYGYDFNPHETKDLWNLSLRKHNKIALFNNHRCVVKEGLSIPVQDYADSLRSWCKMMEYTTPTASEINKGMEKLGIPQSHNRRVRIWKGIGWKDSQQGGLENFHSEGANNEGAADAGNLTRKVHQKAPLTFLIRQENILALKHSAYPADDQNENPFLEMSPETNKIREPFRSYYVPIDSIFERKTDFPNLFGIQPKNRLSGDPK